jgi:DeoR family transcriptional regulator, fructose operon transcriptional repressor
MSTQHVTVGDPSTSRRLPAGRQAALVAYVDGVGAATVAELSERFGVSADTIRRDLDRLDADGVVTRTHGGALGKGGAGQRERDFDTRMRIDLDAKEAIGRRAADLVSDETAVVIGSGTTTLAFAQHLGERRNLIVMTNNLLVPGAIAPESVRDLYLLGGAIRMGGQATVGPVVFGAGTGAERSIRCDLAVIGVGGVDAGMGVSTSHVGEAQMMGEMMRISRRVAVLADSTKFDLAMFAQIVPLADIDFLVTDTAPTGELAAALDDAEVQVLTP